MRIANEKSTLLEESVMCGYLDGTAEPDERVESDRSRSSVASSSLSEKSLCFRWPADSPPGQ
jgi:hypothetical protein